MTAPTWYFHPRCGTCLKAGRWLQAQGINVAGVDLTTAPPDATTIRSLHARSGLPLRRFFNTSGQSYRNGGFGERIGNMTEDEMLQSLGADGMLVKRPILDLGSRVLVGFREDEWAAALASTR